jgi:hypothetical protein
MGWAIFGAIFSQTRLVNQRVTSHFMKKSTNRDQKLLKISALKINFDREKK